VDCWNNFTRRAPHKARALADLAALGVSRELALAVVAELPPELGIEQAQRLPYALLARRIATCGAPGENGGALALLGPPGCGKTTTLAKLAARWVLERDPADLLLISTDEERLGSHEQLRALGRVLGARVEVCADPTMLAALVQVLPAGTLALIDTAGHSPQGGGEGEVRALRDASSRLQTVLVLPASAQTGFIEDVLAQPLAKQALCCVLTRVDEAVSLGGALSAVARAGLPLAWVSDGPRIPEDLKPARAHQLVARAVELARQSPAHADDELLARRYGGSLGAAA
jgi:flagellar biosynthesis protein FlhF